MIVHDAAATFVDLIDAARWWARAAGAAVGVLTAAGLAIGIRAVARRRTASLDRSDYDTAA